MRKLLLLICLGIFLGFPPASEAALFDMGDGTIYDNDTQLTWMKDGLIFGTYKFKTEIDAWVADLTLAGFDNWRIPDWTEMAHVYYRELGAGFWENSARPFVNLLLPEFYYFTGGPMDELPYMDSSFFSSPYYDPGRQDPSSNITDWIQLGFPWAVRPGFRETLTSVFEPETIFLLSFGLFGLAGVRRKFKNN
jgi:hypothetical protein